MPGDFMIAHTCWKFIHLFKYLLSIYYVSGILVCEYINEQGRQGPCPAELSLVGDREN